MKRLLISTFLLGVALILTAQPLKEGNLYKKAVAKRTSKITSSPGGGSTEGGVKEMDIVYIYEKAGSGYYKVGTDEKKAIGYMSGEDLQMWNTRICVHFTPMAGRKPALVFDDASALENCLGGSEDFYTSSGAPHSASLAQEPDDERTADRFSMLLPVLDKKRSRAGSSSNTLYEVGFLVGGGAAAAEPSSSRTTPKPKSKVAELELMFLIDATASMQPYIEATKDVIGAVTKRILKSREGGVRFGATAYRDYIDEQEEMEFITRQIINLTPNSRAVINELETVYEASVDSEDFAEAVFDGYFGAITETSWKESPNTLRIVILIGDASGHEPGHAKNPLNYSVDLLLNKASENRVRTIAVKINSGRDDEKLAKSQFYSIAEGAGIADKGTFIEVDYPESEYDVGDFIEKTSAQIEAEIIRLEKMIDVIEDTKDTPGDDIIFRDDITPIDRAIILKNIKIEKGSTDPFVFSTGWINELTKDGKKNLEAYAYMTKNEFDLMMTYIKLVNQVIDNPDLALGGTMKEVIESVTGETLEGRDLASHYKKTMGLPIKTDILKIPSEEISSWGDERKRRMLQLIKDKVTTIETWGVSLDNWNTAPGGTGEKYTFIPLDMLP